MARRKDGWSITSWQSANSLLFDMWCWPCPCPYTDGYLQLFHVSLLIKWIASSSKESKLCAGCRQFLQFSVASILFHISVCGQSFGETMRSTYCVSIDRRRIGLYPLLLRYMMSAKYIILCEAWPFLIHQCKYKIAIIQPIMITLTPIIKSYIGSTWNCLC